MGVGPVVSPPLVSSALATMVDLPQSKMDAEMDAQFAKAEEDLRLEEEVRFVAQGWGKHRTRG